MAARKLPDWVVSDLKRSGITIEQAAKLKIQPFEKGETSDLIGKNTSESYGIPYFNLQNKPVHFMRYKLREPLDVNQHSTMRYWQPKKSPPHLYFPPLVSWAEVSKNPKLEIWVTEGEKKAAALCALGVPCLAVSGVWSWRSKRTHQALLPEFKALLPRDIVLCFDSDADENLDIKGALTALATELERRGGSVKLATMPHVVDGKTGLDDFIVHYKKTALKQLSMLEKEPLGIISALHELNSELITVEDQQEIFHLKHGKFFPTEKLRTVGYADRRVATWDASGKPMNVPVIDEWLKWPQRRRVQSLVYAPGEPQLTGKDERNYNLWTPSTVQQSKKPCPLFQQLLDFLATDLKPEEKKWWIQWMAYPLQHPGAKLYSAVIMYSHHGGTGKTLLGYTLQRIYGESNCAEVDQSELHSSFNTWARCKQFIIGAEISGTDKRTDSDKLKHMITRKLITINEKYQPTYSLQDVCNYMLTTNHGDAVHIEGGDRRYFVINTLGKPLPQSFYAAYDAFYKSDEGIDAIYGYLMRVDLKGFLPEAPPMATRAKDAMREVSGSEVDLVIRELLRNPSSLPTPEGSPNKRELFTLNELQALLDPTGKMTRLQISKALIKAGAPPGMLTGIPNSKRSVILYAISNFERWTRARHQERAEYFYGLQQSPPRVKRAEKVKGKMGANGRLH